ncbi:hypothetical protein HPB47_027870 [Ixodes persulcatus]|uniref:Uncharacterized protein n=1 Tax=Ixodes persulcatus TaxID=34615 RepID=A0AC60PUU8_IXOPE|nr:hypothetical protein HPB47_027870 [Ixodes persulcatus]
MDVPFPAHFGLRAQCGARAEFTSVSGSTEHRTLRDVQGVSPSRDPQSSSDFVAVASESSSQRPTQTGGYNTAYKMDLSNREAMESEGRRSHPMRGS